MYVRLVAEHLDPEAVVIRFAPTSLESVMKKAKQEFRRSGHHRLSVFADTPRPGETPLDTERRLVQAAGLANINLDSNRRYWVGRGRDLTESFEAHKDGYEGEPREHYSLDLGDDAGLADACQDFLGKFRGPEKVER